MAASSVAVAGQAPPARTEFLDAIGQFSLALDGTHGDEGKRLPAILDAAADALARWDAAVQSYERAMAAQIAAAEPPVAAKMHVELGSVYLDRGRIQEALEQFAKARAAGVAGSEAPLFQAVAQRQVLNQPGQAIQALRAAVSSDPQNPALAYTLARHLMEAGADEEALEALRLFLAVVSKISGDGVIGRAPFLRLGLVQEQPKVEPFLPPVLYAEAYATLQRGDLHLAVEQLRKAVALDPLGSSPPDSDADPRARAAAAFRDGRVAEARDLLETVIAPLDAEAQRVLGMVNMADGRYNDAVAALRAAVRLNMDDERTRLALANALVASGQLDAAEETLRDTLDLVPSSGRAHYALGLLFRTAGKPVEAIAALRAALGFTPFIGANTIHRMIGSLLREQQDLDGAAKAFAARSDATPNDPDGHRDLGKLYFQQGRNLDARVEFEVARMLDPTDVEAYTGLGQVHLREGRHDEAAEASRRALSIDPAHREARYVHATSLIRLGNQADGTREMQEFQRLQDEDAEARARAFELGRLRREAAVATTSGDHATAALLLRQALVLDPRSPSSHLDLGVALLDAGQLDQAVERLETAAALNARIDVHRRLAEAYAALGRTDDSQRAQAVYERRKQDAIRRTGGIR